MALKEEVDKLHEERNMLLETIEDLKQTVSVPELDTKVINDAIVMCLYYI